MHARYHLRIRSRLQTPLQSDTIFGHLCWAIRDLDGEAALSDFLQAMNSHNPPLLFSSGLPHGYLPRPVLPPPSRESTRTLALQLGHNLANHEQGRLFLGLSKLKKLMKRPWVRVSDWTSLQDNLTHISLLHALEASDSASSPKGPVSLARAHVALSRQDNRVMDPGGLYFTREHWYPDDTLMDVYCWFADSSWQDIWERAWEQVICPVGFGKDKSTGAGRLEMHRDQDFDPSLFTHSEPTAWMNLSHACLEDFHHGRCWYRPQLKLGKLGGSFAVHGPDGGRANPFKKPILMQGPGSVSLSPEPPVGRLLSNVHTDERIRHSGLCLCIPFVYGGAA
ncbi:MAG: type III-A CRISPR-associated RAMP protein Csm4 [Desulfovermiculus sp.]